MLKDFKWTRLRIRAAVRAVLILGTTISIMAGLSMRAAPPEDDTDWRMAGHDAADTRSQPGELRIGPRNAFRLAPRWVATTSGDVSATAAVVVERGKRVRGVRLPSVTAVYFPDWGGKLWKIDGDTGRAIWVRSISEYSGISGAISRSSPVVDGESVFVGDLNGNLIAVDAATGNLKWISRLDPNPAAIVTSSPILHGNRLYVNLSSNEQAYARQNPGYVCCTFRGSLVAVDTRTGRIIWKSFVLPDFGGPGGFAGGAFVNPPAIDTDLGLIYAASGQLYTQPPEVTQCLAAAPGNWSESCFPKSAHFNSVVAFDLKTGKIKWSFRGAGPEARQLACGDLPADVTWCPGASDARSFSVWDFAGSGPNVFRARIRGRMRNVVGIGQKSGVYWALDGSNGRHLWSTLVGPGSDPGGIQWGTAYDGKRIYAAIGHNTGEAYRLPTGETITGGSWAALDPSTGRILWQTADPQGAADLAALSVANGVLYGGSMAHTGNQMYALDTTTGEILWGFASGGSVVDGPAIVDGAVYWGSGYGRTGGIGNTKFYGFSIDGR